MSFISLEFAALCAITALLYFIIPSRFRWIVLLLASLIFYALTGVLNLLILLASTLIDYAAARAITASEDDRRRKLILWGSLAQNVLLLVGFKVAGALGTGIAIPLGLSFYTFMKIAYVLDVYWKKIQPERHLGKFATFTSFFLTITSGPIERAGHLIPQLAQPAGFVDSRVVEGLRRVLVGVFKKVVIADTLALYVNAVYDAPEQFGGVIPLVATLFLAFQIYADFAGYTDIVIGLAHLLGINLFENFNQPYFATSILDFWRRWHISLTNWIRDYLFMPLTRFLLTYTKRRIPNQWIQAVTYLIIMGLVGLWHGVSWGFLIWGLLHGLYMGAEMLLPARFRQPPGSWQQAALRMVLTFVLVDFAWVWFRSATLGDGAYIVTHLIPLGGWMPLTAPVPAEPDYLLRAVALIGLLLGYDLLDAQIGAAKLVARLPLPARWAWYYAVIIPIFLTLNTYTGLQDFIYFQF